MEGRPLGPAHYMAYEMILNPASADPHPADVYSLGKPMGVATIRGSHQRGTSQQEHAGSRWVTFGHTRGRGL